MEILNLCQGIQGHCRLLFSRLFSAWSWSLLFIMSSIYIKSLKGYTSSYIWIQLKTLLADIMSLWHKERTKLLTIAYYSLLPFLRQLVTLSCTEDKQKELTPKHLNLFCWQYFHIRSHTGISALCQDIFPDPSGLRLCKSQKILK